LFGTDPSTTIKWLDININRNRRLKSKTDIEKLGGDEIDIIFYPSIIDIHYPSRPPDLESICLFDYVRLYDIVKTKPVGKNIKQYEYPNYGYIKERTRPYLIKHTIYNIQSELEKYFYSFLMLFQPWRQEVSIIANHKTYLDAFIGCRDKIELALHYHERLEYLRKISKDYLDTNIQLLKIY